MPTIWLTLPAYNEERSLPPLLERCIPLGDALGKQGDRLAVLVVDDGSGDGTIAAARAFEGRLALEVVPHGVNRGLGAALRTGVEAGLQRSAEEDFIATMDADNTHDPGLIPEMVRRIRETGADVVIASRYAPGGQEVGLTRLRQFLSRGASFLLTLTTPVTGARDYTCGFRLYRVSTLRRAQAAWGERLIEEAGFTCMAELLLKLGRGGARVTESPLVLRYDLKEGASKMKMMRTISRYFTLIRRIRSRPMPRVA
ncbi:MAG TPA: glycosyltransferase family 2 protein [Candidatus Udaeobacter sp.]|nr:glycosyltransferase family 2 protein [Candidatus Udaeobacter sp.]